MVLLFLAMILLGWCPAVFGQWSEPTITPDMMTAPLTPPPVTGTTFYVDKNSLGGTCNNSNAGTSVAAPWCTIAKAMTTLTAGQRAYVRAGTYNEGSLHPTNSGTPGNYITMQAYPGDAQPVLNCAGNTFCWDGNFAWSYWVWNGFEAHSPGQQFFVQASTGNHHIWFVNNKLHNSSTNTRGHEGFEIRQTNNVLSNNEAYDNPVHFAGSNGHDNIFEFNHVYDNGRNGDDEGAIKCGAGAVYNCVLRYNIIHNNWRDPATATAACFNPGNCQGVSGLYIDISTDSGGSHPGAMSYIYNNIVYDNDIGINLFEAKGVRVFNNITYHNGFTAGFAAGFVNSFGHGLTIEGSTTVDIQVYNNVSYNSRNRGFNYGGVANNQIISRNNIGMNNGTDFAQFSIANGNHNYDLMFNNVGGVLINWNNTTYTSLSAFLARGGNTTWLNAINADPQFVNAATGNFHLQTTSPAKDAGQTQTLMTFDKDNQTRPQGSAWDIGAYEFVSSGTAPIVLRVIR